MTDKNEKVEKPDEAATTPEEVKEETTEEVPTEPATDEEESQKEPPSEEETPNETEDPGEEAPEEKPAVSELRISNHENGRIVVNQNGLRLSNRTAIAVFSAKGYKDLLQVIKSNRIKPGKTWEGNLEDLKDAPKGKK